MSTLAERAEADSDDSDRFAVTPLVGVATHGALGAAHLEVVRLTVERDEALAKVEQVRAIVDGPHAAFIVERVRAVLVATTRCRG